MTHGRWRAKFCFLPSFLRFLSLSSGIHTAALPFPESHHSSSLRPVTIHVSSLFNPRGAVRALFLFYRSLFFLSLSLSLSFFFLFPSYFFFPPYARIPLVDRCETDRGGGGGGGGQDADEFASRLRQGSGRCVTMTRYLFPVSREFSGIIDLSFPFLFFFFFSSSGITVACQKRARLFLFSFQSRFVLIFFSSIYHIE